jgi:hypothetical protein
MSTPLFIIKIKNKIKETRGWIVIFLFVLALFIIGFLSGYIIGMKKYKNIQPIIINKNNP